MLVLFPASAYTVRRSCPSCNHAPQPASVALLMAALRPWLLHGRRIKRRG
jgi:hypothetical protein